MEIQHTKTWDTANAVLERKFKAINTYIKKKPQINDLNLDLNKLWKELSPKLTEIIKIAAKINKI